MDGSHLPGTFMTNRPLGYVEFRQRCSADFHQLNISKTCTLYIRSGFKTVWTFAGVETTVEQGELVYLHRSENLTIGNIIGNAGLQFSKSPAIEDNIISDFLQLHPNPSTAREVRKGTIPNGFNDAFLRVVASPDDPALYDEIFANVSAFGTDLTTDNQDKIGALSE